MNKHNFPIIPLKSLIKGCLIFTLLFVMSTTNALAHKGRTDSSGGHWDRKAGTYHYHNSGSSGSSSSGSSGSSSSGSSSSGSSSNSTPKSSPSLAPTPAPKKPITVVVDGETIKFDQQPENINGRVMVPIRYVVEKMGCSVDWDNATKTVYVNAKGASLEKKAKKTENINVFVYNEKINFTDQLPINKNGRVLIPVRFVAEKLNYPVTWDSESQTVYIKKS